ncbi:CDP-diacylglycerol--glycerol-3-phosphate 3-phosphatidyltransferase [Candidatus Odyssella acanthamoebae]|uniref:CDP-diacylglycerol--glycerol-3-phosphate 3-phosphatidyltransferase n=1 Tax=Candidatus Odyssella acanthamoebae TaxID=91604 RepID=A0A077AWE5_9PROT|nr:CDP-diacylglycerol--glycerol-3-phosphate 3-phosphatidyltransferase [Candidatus Paracaedibacter acanthamoebae]AIK95948.1 CDP-diacylglycerol--glycerol-3-phosphate 3-phosphatidyltransferase [Candidatus Paracaedibacter acanthamoebae]
MLTIPNILTFIRILLIPVVVIAFYIDTVLWRWLAVFAFASACFTDYLDGYLARLLKQTSKLGTFLDPIADKLLVATTLLYMAGYDKISRLSLIPAAIILCREIMVSGLREHLSEINVPLPVSNLAKWKTAAQMGAITILLIGDVSKRPIAWIGELFLWIAGILTIMTAYSYLSKTIKNFDN